MIRNNLIGSSISYCMYQRSEVKSRGYYVMSLGSYRHRSRWCWQVSEDILTLSPFHQQKMHVV